MHVNNVLRVLNIVSFLIATIHCNRDALVIGVREHS